MSTTEHNVAFIKMKHKIKMKAFFQFKHIKGCKNIHYDFILLGIIFRIFC